MVKTETLMLKIITLGLLFCHAGFVVAKTTGDQQVATITVFKEHDMYVEASPSYGLSWRILSAAAEHQGIHLVVQESSWRASLSRLKAHKVDLVYAAFKTAEREQWANFSLPLMTDGSAIFGRLDDPATAIDEIDFDNAVVGVSANSVQEQFAKDAGFKNIYSTVDRAQLYKMILQRRIDYLFFGTSIINYYCVYYDPSRQANCMKQIGRTFDENTVHAISVKGNAKARKILQRLDAGIRELARQGHYKKWFEHYDLKPAVHQKWLTTLSL